VIWHQVLDWLIITAFVAIFVVIGWLSRHAP
jgi:hypothetical protein